MGVPADFDLTGQKLWPASHLLAKYLQHQGSQKLSRNTVACELGAGLGLVSLICAAYCPVVATDHSTEVLGILQQNCELNPTSHSIRYSICCTGKCRA